MIDGDSLELTYTNNMYLCVLPFVCVFSKVFQNFFRSISKCFQKDFKMFSKGLQIFSKGFQNVVKRISKCFQKDLKMLKTG